MSSQETDIRTFRTIKNKNKTQVIIKVSVKETVKPTAPRRSLPPPRPKTSLPQEETRFCVRFNRDIDRAFGFI